MANKPFVPENPDEIKDLTEIVNQFSYIKKPPPPPIKMLVSEYIEFLNFLKSNPKELKRVLAALDKYNMACTEAGNILTDELKQVFH
jgi:hypothetical protein